ncbi:multiheme c-type cytochrome [Glaciecola sp. 1036]|uniref:multiheme c-type cytochrome n=1 Tax=Alteromonadaceae TaxID=72275 RepID=UPI003CFDB0B4
MFAVKNLLQSEQRLSKWMNATMLASFITGLVAWIIDLHNVYTQINSLVHILIGTFFFVLATPYFYVHFRRTLAFRRAGLIFSGLCLLALWLVLIYTGFYIAIFGLSESTGYVLQVHLVSVLSFVAVLILHILVHVVFFPKNRQKSTSGQFPSYTKGSKSLLLKVNIAVQASMLLVVLGFAIATPEKTPTQAIIQPYQYNYGEHKFRPAQTETHDDQFVRYEDIAKSQKCVNCHTELGEQWMSSIHRMAAADPAYVTNIDLLTKNKGMSAARYCEGCHAPIALLTGQLTEGGFHGGTINTQAHAEGISCMSCHGIQSLSHEKGNGSYVFAPSTDYLFAETSNAMLEWINERLIKVNPAQHRKEMANPLIQDPKMCASCHSQFMDKEMNSWGWLKMQDEYSAWVDSPYAQHHDREFANADYTRCQDCHMPLVDAKDPSANTDGKARSHRFIGANTFVPVMRNDKTQFELTKKFLQTNKIRLDIDEPNRQDAYHSEFHLDESLRDLTEAPFFFYLGETAKLDVVVTNVGVGHDFPGGTIDINQVWLEFKVVDAHGEVVYHSGDIDEQGFVDQDAYFYRSKPVDRFGNHVWKHDLFNMVGRSFKRTIPAGKSDIVNYSFDVPMWVEPPLTATVRLRYRKLNNQYATWALKEQYFALPIVDMAWESLDIPIELVPKVIDHNASNKGDTGNVSP